MKKKEQYIGDKAIESITGNTVVFKDGTSEDYTEKQLSYIITDEPKDLSQFEEIIIKNVSKDCMDLLGTSDLDDVIGTCGKILYLYEEHNISMKQNDKINALMLGKYKEILQTVNDSFDIGYKIAVGKAFGTYKEGLHHDYFIENIKASDIKRLKNFI